jgi:hypothetical protein
MIATTFVKMNWSVALISARAVAIIMIVGQAISIKLFLVARRRVTLTVQAEEELGIWLQLLLSLRAR